MAVDYTTPGSALDEQLRQEQARVVFALLKSRSGDAGEANDGGCEVDIRKGNRGVVEIDRPSMRLRLEHLTPETSSLRAFKRLSDFCRCLSR
jgi:hypothetical protein